MKRNIRIVYPASISDVPAQRALSSLVSAQVSVSVSVWGPGGVRR